MDTVLYAIIVLYGVEDRAMIVTGILILRTCLLGHLAMLRSYEVQEVWW
jgi:hypothetical protein